MGSVGAAAAAEAGTGMKGRAIGNEETTGTAGDLVTIGDLTDTRVNLKTLLRRTFIYYLNPLFFFHFEASFVKVHKKIPDANVLVSEMPPLSFLFISYTPISFLSFITLIISEMPLCFPLQS